jgi:hypothetical protein
MGSKILFRTVFNNLLQARRFFLHGKKTPSPLLNRTEQVFCCPRCSHLSTVLNNIVDPESGVTILFNIVDSYEQCGRVRNNVPKICHIL